MMQAALPRSLKEQFALTADMREEEIVYREKMARFAARQREKTAEHERTAKEKEAEARAFLEHAFAPPERLAEFKVKLDTYDAKTVEALIENQEALDAVRRRLDEMLDKAHVLPDGRRVFKTQDGQRVFDEQGQEVRPETLDPAAIDDRKPRWERFKADKDARTRLDHDRQGLLDYQAKLDQARDRLDNGDVTTRELDDMERDLRVAMPDAVRAKVEPDRPKADAAPTPQSVPSMPDGMDSLMRQTGFGQPAAPGMR